MGQKCEQFYRTWCYSGRSVSGADGWKIRAKSDGLALQEAEAMADLANYWSPTSVSASRPPGRRLALFRQSEGAVLSHGVSVFGLVGGRAGVSFEHVVVGLPKDVSALEAVRFWGSAAWCLEDGDFGSKLGKFAWHRDAYGPEFAAAREVTESGDVGDGDGAIALRFLGESDVVPWASYVLRACLATTSGMVAKFYLAGKDDTIARLLFVAFYCLPERLRREVTFSTHENPKGTKGVQVVGVTTFEGEESDFAAYCYGGKYCALNTFTETKAENLAASSFAESAVQWILYGQYGLLAQVRDSFDALDPADSPVVGDLDLLAACAPTGGDGPVEAEMLLKLCGSPAIGHSKVRDRDELSVLVKHARGSTELRDGFASQLAGWLPKHAVASKEFPAVLAQVAFGKLREGRAFDEVAWLADFVRRVGSGLEIRYWEELLLLCQGWVGRGGSAEAPLPAVATRVSLVGVWQQWHRLPVQRDGDAFADVVDCWLRVEPQDLRFVLSSELRDELKREAVGLWVGSRSSEDFRRVMKQARDDGRFRGQVIGQLAGLLKERRDAVGGFPSALAGVALGDLRGGGAFAEVSWLGSFAGEAGAEMESRFWGELMVACHGTMSQAAGGKGLLPALETRVSLLQMWERLSRVREQGGYRALAEFWLRVVPRELAQVLQSSLPFGLKGEAVKLCLAGNTALDAQTGELIFTLICRDAELTRVVFLGMPIWRAGGAGVIRKVPDSCLSKLLSWYVERLRLADLVLDEGLMEKVARWSVDAPRAVPPRLQMLLSFGRYAKTPSAFTQRAQLAPELFQPEFWARERDREEAVNGALKGLLERGDLGDFERALDWFGERKWASSGADLIRLAHRFVSAKSVRCRDAVLEGLLSILDRVLKEWEEAGQGRAAARKSDGVALRGMESRGIGALGRVAMRHLPGSSLLKSPTGQQIIEILDAESQLLEPIQRGWVQNLHSLLEVCNATDFLSEMIETLATSYVALDKEGDADMRTEVNALLLKLVAKKPKALGLALVAFVNSVYAKNENLFLRGFMPGLVEELIRLEQKSESGAVAEVFVSFCLEGCFLEQGGNFADRRSSEMAGWLGRFKRGLTPKSIACVNRVAREWDAGTRDRWYRVSGYRPSWISSRLSDMKKRREEKRLQKKQEKLRGRYSPRKKRRGRMLVPVLVLSALGLVGWLVYPQLVRSVVYPHREPVEQGKRLGVWLDQYRKSMLAVQESDRDVPRKDAEGAIRKIGTNALPALLRMVQAKDSAAGTRVVRVLGLRSEDDYHTRSTDGFAVLGAGAKPAVGALVRALGDKSSGIRACAATCLGSIGPEAKDAVPALRQLFGDRVITVRTAATNAIAQVDVGAGAGAGGGKVSGGHARAAN